MRRIVTTAVALAAVAGVGTAQAATIDLKSGNGPVGGRDHQNAVVFTTATGPTSYAAYIVAPNPAYHAPIGTSRYISPNADGKGGTANDYETTFTLPANATNISLSGSLLADNEANDVLLNGHLIASQPNGCDTANFQTPTTFSDSTAGDFVAGQTNTIRFDTTNCGETDGFTALDYVIKVTYDQPKVTLSPAGDGGALYFSDQEVGTQSPPTTETLKNTGSAPLSISSIATTDDSGSGAFGITSNCPVGGTLAKNQSCTIAITFQPTAHGYRDGVLTITDNASDSPQTVSLSGFGTQGTASVSPSSLTFPTTQTGSTSAGKQVTITNTGDAPLENISFSTTGPFHVTGVWHGGRFGTNCPSAPNGLGIGDSCTVTVVFQPANRGTQTGTLVVHNTGQTGDQTVQLSGNACRANCFQGSDQTAQAGVSKQFTTATLVDQSFSQPTGTTLNTLSAIIHWGDGTSSHGQVIVTGPHTISVRGTHTYASPGTYTITTVINPGQPGSQRITETVTVS